MHLKGMYINSAKQKQKQKQQTNKESHRTDSFLK
jgi:hypothetical protein